MGLVSKLITHGGRSMSVAERQEKLNKLYDELNRAQSGVWVDHEYVCYLVCEITRLENAV